MSKLKRNNRMNTVFVLINVLLGVVLWALIAAVISWLVLSDRLSESSSNIVAPLMQGLIVYIVAIISFLGWRGEKAITRLIAPITYLAVQIIVSLLFWETSFNEMIRGSITFSFGVALSFLTYKLKNKYRKNKTYYKWSR